MSKKKKFDSIIKWIFGIGTVGMAAKAGAKIKQYQVEHNPTEEAENTVGYNDISVRYNTEVHTNNFVVLHVKNTPGYDISDIRAKLEKCNELNIPVIWGVSEGAAKYMGGFKVVSAMVKAMVESLNIEIPVCIHLDHGSSFESCKNAIDAGLTSVRIDGSKHELSENIRITKAVVEYAHERGVVVEAEIGVK
mgnify:CR=1 FL=1